MNSRPSDLKSDAVPSELCRLGVTWAIVLTTVSAHIEPRGSIFQNEFLGGVLLIFGIGGVVIKMGFY